MIILFRKLMPKKSAIEKKLNANKKKERKKRRKMKKLKKHFAISEMSLFFSTYILFFPLSFFINHIPSLRHNLVKVILNFRELLSEEEAGNMD